LLCSKMIHEVDMILCLARSCERWDNEPPAQFPARVVHGEIAAGNPRASSAAAVGLPASSSAARADGPDSRPRDGAARRCCNGRAGPASAASDHGHDAGTSCVGAASRALALLAQHTNGSSVLWRPSWGFMVRGEVCQVPFVLACEQLPRLQE
jgi:hypothetical protein